MTAVLSGDICADVTGAVVQPASASPMTEEGLRSRLCRTGDSLFTFSSLEIEMDDNIFLPVSAVNALRREVLSLLQDKILQSADRQRHQKASGYAASDQAVSDQAASDQAASDRILEQTTGQTPDQTSGQTPDKTPGQDSVQDLDLDSPELAAASGLSSTNFSIIFLASDFS